jgi:hypothetical protein
MLSRKEQHMLLWKTIAAFGQEDIDKAEGALPFGGTSLLAIKKYAAKEIGIELGSDYCAACDEAAIRLEKHAPCTDAETDKRCGYCPIDREKIGCNTEGFGLYQQWSFYIKERLYREAGRVAAIIAVLPWEEDKNDAPAAEIKPDIGVFVNSI